MSKHDDYHEIMSLLKSPDWLAWVKFLRERSEYLKNKLATQINSNQMDDARRTAAIAEDTLKQIDLFMNRKNTIEQELKNQ